MLLLLLFLFFLLACLFHKKTLFHHIPFLVDTNLIPLSNLLILEGPVHQPLSQISLETESHKRSN